MQGKKVYQEKLFSNFRLSRRVSPTNFYRRLKEVLDLSFLYKKQKTTMAHVGKRALTRLCSLSCDLDGYLENIISDRKLIDHCSMRLDILYFPGFDIDEKYGTNCQLCSFPADTSNQAANPPITAFIFSS